MTIKWAGPWVAHSANCCDIDQGVTLQGEFCSAELIFFIDPFTVSCLEITHFSAHEKFKVAMHTRAQEQ